MTKTSVPSLRSCGFAALSLASLLAASVQAQDHFDVETFEPAPDISGSILNVYGGRALAPGAYSLSLTGSYGRKPLSMEDDKGHHLGDLIGSVGTLQLLGAVGVAKHFDIGFGVPVHRLSAGTDPGNAPTPAVQSATVKSTDVAFGDVRVVPRVSLYEHDKSSGFDVALFVPVWLPTGHDELYAGESFRVQPSVALDYQHKRVTAAVNAGYLVRQKSTVLDTEVDDQARVGGGLEVGLFDKLSLLAELNAHFNMSEKSAESTASEAHAGLRYRASGFIAQLGGGPGLTRAATTPTYRLFASLGYTGSFVKPKRDSDADGLLDERDACPQKPEDRDGFEDGDGCPDPDNDGDGVPDASDQCVSEPEDADGFADADGCRDPDNDGDQILDETDACPNQVEDKDGFQDEDGCLDADNDGDGILDGSDKCPQEAGVAAESGCPAPEPVKVTDTNIELSETVFFAYGSDQIDPQSFPLLESVAKVLNEHPEITRVMIEGHTDDRGSASFNKALSSARAKSVMQALVARGVSADRLTSEGFGMSKPLVPNDNDDNRAKNRRVEMRILERASGETPQ